MAEYHRIRLQITFAHEVNHPLPPLDVFQALSSTPDDPPSPLKSAACSGQGYLVRHLAISTFSFVPSQPEHPTACF